MSTRDTALAILTDKAPQAQAALPPNTIDVERLRVGFIAAFNKKPELADCSPMSLANCFINCASLGLVPETPEQLAYLIPRRNKATGNTDCELQIGYRGFSFMMYRAGAKIVETGIVYQGDVFEHQIGDGAFVRHTKSSDLDRHQKPIVFAWALVKLSSGENKVEVMPNSDLEKIFKAMMRQNFDKASPAWREWPDEMRRKAPLKRLAKTANLGALVARAAEIDNSYSARMERQEPKPLTLATGEALETPAHVKRLPAGDTLEPKTPLDPQDAEGNFKF